MAAFLRFDVLQLIGLSLVALRLLHLVFRQEGWFLGATTLAALAIVIGAPFVWTSEAIAGTPPWLLSALTGNSGSPFPIFPMRLLFLPEWWCHGPSYLEANSSFLGLVGQN